MGHNVKKHNEVSRKHNDSSLISNKEYVCGIEHISSVGPDEAEHLAIVVRNNKRYTVEEGKTEFITESKLPLQIGFGRLPSEGKIRAHKHNPVSRTVYTTTEVIIITKGILKVEIYDSLSKFIRKVTLTPGDLIMLMKGGHSFECIDECEYTEIKQGPHVDDKQFI